MASHIIEIDEDIEIKLLLNFSINKVSDLPNNVCEILNGRYEDVINNELSIFIEAIKNGDNLEEIIHNSLSETHTHLSWLCTGVASLLYFIQCNWTGPPIDRDIDWLKTRRDEALNHLSLYDGCNINIRKPELIYLSKKIFSDVDLQLKYKSCIWWLFRATLMHQHILDENTGVLFEETENLIIEINNLNILEHPLCKLLFNLEAGTFYLYYKRSQNSEKHLECAQKIAGLKLNLEGAMGKRTKYQQEEKPQLYLKIEMNKDTFLSIDCENVPRSLSLNDFDDLRLDCIEFSEHKEETKLGMIEEAIILGKYVQLQLCQPTYELTDEEIRPYLSRVIESTKNWSLKMTSLYYRCSSESNNKRTINRSMKQTQSLINDYNDVKVPIARRMDLFFASGMRPIWMLEEKWANLMFSFGDVKTALEVFIKLELWEDVIVCYNVLNLKHKAIEIIEQEISKKPTVKLWCLLGDATGDVSHYEVAWKLSDEKSSRVQKHWGLYYFAKKNYVEAIPHLKLSVELNNIQEDVWFRLGYAALQIEDWKLAAMAYKRYCSLEQFAFEAWNNLAKAYIKLGDKTTAWKFLQDAIASCYDCWQIWDNLMIVSIDLGHFSEVIRCYHRILDLKNNHLDVQVLQILTNAIVNNISDANGNPASRLLQNSLELFGRITSNILNNPDIWRMYAELVVLKKTDVDEERAAQYLQKAYRFITSNPWSHSEAATLKMSFVGKVVLITGASSGIGAATAIHLSQFGASLSISGRNKDNLEKVAKQCGCGQSKPFIITGELTNENDVKNIIDSTIKHYGKLDVLINSAGILANGSIETTSLEEYDKIFNINVRSIYQLTMLAVPHLIKTKGNIVNISSVNGLRSFSGCLAYCMSKAALDQFTRCVALDLASKQIRVNAINPGVIATKLHETSGMDKDQLKNFFERGKQTHALGRTGNVSEVAKTIAFLASDEASFITGATLPVDGGRHAMCPR